MKRTRLTALATAGALCLALTGCGGSSSSSGSTSSGSASSSTKSATESSTSSSSTSATKASGDTVSLGDLQTKMMAAMKAKGTVKMAMTAAGQTMNAVMRYGDSTAFSMEVPIMDTEPTQIIVIDGVLYMKANPDMQMLSGGKPWIKVDPKATDPFSQSMAPLLSTLENSSNPLMGADLPDVEATLVSEDGGNKTYEIALTAEQVQAMGEKLMAGLPSSTATSQSTPAPEPVTMRVTVDANYLPMKSVVQSGGTTTELTYTDWGADVTIEAPPADQVGTLDLGGLMPTATAS